MRAIKTALISVSNKHGLVEFAQGLVAHGIDILSTGGTAASLREAGISVRDVSAYTGFPEMMDGRLKTLHPKIHGGILGRIECDATVMQENNIVAIDLVVVNLYPFVETIADPRSSFADAVENIDIGGPTMIRAAAKNHAEVAVVVDPGDYDRILAALGADQRALDDRLRFDLATKAFTHTAAYDQAIAEYFCGGREASEFPDQLSVVLAKHEDLRYGENPHQGAAFYREASPLSGSVSSAEQIQGKALSYNNIADTDAAVECVWAFDAPACCIVKHANPCGVAEADSIRRAYELAYATDPTSAFGGIIAFNRELDEQTAADIIARQFVEVIAAPAISPAARAVCTQKSGVRVLELGERDPGRSSAWDYKRVTGGLLVQHRDPFRYDFAEDELQIVTTRAPGEGELRDLLFAWRVVKCVKSNAIVYARARQTLGIGAGQMSRVYSARIAALKAADENLDIGNAVMASDAFFPFRDSIDAAADAGIAAVIQPGGSIRDDEVIASANEHDIAMVFTGMRHFRH